MSEKAPLKVGIEDGQLVIRIGVETLAFCTTQIAAGPERDWHVMPRNAHGFAKNVARQMETEDASGETPITMFLDKMMDEAADAGSLAVTENKP